MEVLTEPEDIRLNRESTKVQRNAEYENPAADVSDNDRVQDDISSNSYHRLEVIAKPCRSPTTVQFNQDFKDDIQHVSGEASNEEDLVELDSESEYSETFETESDDESSEEVERIEDKSDNGEQMKEDDLGNSIVLRYPEKYGFKAQYVSLPLEVQMRNEALSLLTDGLAGSKFVTDIYGIYESTGKVNRLAHLPIEDSWSEKVNIDVSIKTKYSPHFKYFAYLRREGQWKQIHVKTQNGTAKIRGERIDMLFLTSKPKSETFILDSRGKKFVSRYDKKIRIIFPPGCVEQEEELTVQIFPQTKGDTICIDKEPCIVGASKSVQVHHQKGIFKKPIDMKLHLDLFDNCPDPDLTKYSFVDVHSTSKQTLGLSMHLLSSENSIKDDSGFSVCMTVEDFPKHSAQLGVHSNMITETGKLRVRMAQDEIFHCHILVFVSKKSVHNYQGDSIRIDCVEYTKVDETIEELRQNRHGFIELTRCRSPPIFIEDGEKIRISLAGGMKLPFRFQKSNMLITFLREGLHRHIVFPVDIHYGNRPSQLGYLNFNRVDGQFIHQTFFDVDFPFKAEDSRTAVPARLQTSNEASLDATAPNETAVPARLQTSNETPLDAAASNGTHHLTVPNIILTLTTALPANEWKFIFRAICVADGSEIKADDIISEAEKNNPGDVREVIYQSLQKWVDKKDFRTPREMLDTLIQRLETGDNRRVASVLIQRFNA